MRRDAKTKRNTIIRNLNQLGFPLRAIADGFGVSHARVYNICVQKRAGNPCRKHINVVSYCSACKRSSMEGLAP